MINFKTKENGNVILVEPNSINTNNDIVNSVPKYEDMHIFAELTAESRGRTVITDGNAVSTSSKKVNFIGNNQNTDDPNNLNFTTNYYDGSVEDGTYYEGFGIEHINIKTNSSFIPQVNIKFVDIRGLAFFNQNDSPYRMLFDFPPPIFTLTVKGYYGKSINYKLHLVKYTTEFVASNGNFIIDAQFVAVTFAPLADILFRYVVNFPMINSKETYDPLGSTRPTNTYDLIMKLKNLYFNISNKLETDTENNEYKLIVSEVESINNIMDMLNNIHENEVLTNKGKPFYIVKKPILEFSGDMPSAQLKTTGDYELILLNNISEYNKIIISEETDGLKQNMKSRISIAYLSGTDLPYEYYVDGEVIMSENKSGFVNGNENLIPFKNALNSFRDTLKSNSLTILNTKDSDIGTPTAFDESFNVISSKKNNTQYIGIDITDFYYKMYNKKNELSDNKNYLSSVLAEKINNMVAQGLGMIPTINNIFTIILNDVDTFFDKLRSTSIDAEIKHNTTEAINIISSNNVDTSSSESNVPDHIYSFPLIVNEINVYGGKKKERVAPIELSGKIPFPELILVEEFMNTFLKQRNVSNLYDTRINQDDDGIYKWVPISPIDSKVGGASAVSPYLNVNNSVIDEILTIFIKRFYILSQGTLGDKFYSDDIVGNAYVDMYSKAEAVNIATALVSELNANNVKIMSDKYVSYVDEFYEYLKTINTTFHANNFDFTGNLCEFSPNDTETEPVYFPITPSNLNDGKVYVNKNNVDFKGFTWYTGDIVLQNISETSTSNRPVDNFCSDSKKEFWDRLWSGENIEPSFYRFTEENIIHLSDVTNTNENIINDVPLISRALIGYSPTFSTSEKNTIFGNFPKSQTKALEIGNGGFTEKDVSAKSLLTLGGNIVFTMSNELSKPDIYRTVTTDSGILANMLILSNYGTTASPFNLYPNKLNGLIFNTPAVVELPAFYAPYIGMILYIIDNGLIDTVFDFFESDITGDVDNFDGIGGLLPYKGYFILADIHDVQIYLSDKDKAEFRLAYRNFDGILRDIIEDIKHMNEEVTKGVNKNIFSSLIVGYAYMLNENTSKIKGADYHGRFFSTIINPLMERKSLVNFSDITFKMESSANSYSPLDYYNSVDKYKKINDRFFKSFFNKLSSEIGTRIEEIKKEKIELTKAKGDVDVINQLYYSFKNINDKWLAGTSKTTKGYPQNKEGNKLINSFAFVDRGMNPIGDTVINTEILVDMLDDPNISLFSVLTQLLSLNGFEFFPLQNFIRFNDSNEWEDSFKIDNGAISDKDSSANFVCMYVGGSSSYPSVSGNGFENDGIIDISKPGVPDYLTKPSGIIDEHEETNPDFPWRQVRAFRVRFGEQNQSMFTDFKIDSKEYPETNESIQILSRLAGDNNPDSPVPKGQNLYNLYENRSYKGTITGFGNVMIQPTQYFQLENVPLFDGAYIILSVEHDITANKMTTQFSGTKLLKYPMPRVMNPMAFTSYSPDQSIGNVIVSAANSSVMIHAHYNAMYVNNSNTLKMR